MDKNVGLAAYDEEFIRLAAFVTARQKPRARPTTVGAMRRSLRLQDEIALDRRTLRHDEEAEIVLAVAVDVAEHRE